VYPFGPGEKCRLRAPIPPLLNKIGPSGNMPFGYSHTTLESLRIIEGLE
jgi:hypothetical protein